MRDTDLTILPPPTQARSWGARLEAGGQWSFALWAPAADRLDLNLDGRSVAMVRTPDGVHQCHAKAQEGDRYRFLADGKAFADPASLAQDGGVEGWSRLLSPQRLANRKPRRAPLNLARQVITELHVGTFTREGTFAAAARSPQLQRLAEIGITVIELMPLGQFPGQRGWGYDSVLPYAPQDSYGGPEDLCQLVDTAHDLGLSVYLDVVFNHFGPKGCALSEICPDFFHDAETEWGRKINFGQSRVREYFADCAVHWLRTYHFDGLRFDAIHALEDGSEPPIAADLARRIRAQVPVVHLVAEDSDHVVDLFDPGAGLYDARWDDDYHHALHVLLTRESFGYYKEFMNTPLPDLALALRDGQTLQGQPRPQEEKRRGAPSSHLPHAAFVNFNLNHDHAGNRPKGSRLISLVGDQVAQVAHAFLLTAPYVPLLFMGEEVGSESPFPFFADYSGQLADDMRASRRQQFKDMPGAGDDMLDPFDPVTAHLAWPYAKDDRPEALRWQELTKTLLRLRAAVLQPIFASGRKAPQDVAITGPNALTVDWHFHAGTLRSAVDFSGPAAQLAGSPDGDIDPARCLAAVGDRRGPWFRLLGPF